jgi:hypothetical protein
MVFDKEHSSTGILAGVTAGVALFALGAMTYASRTAYFPLEPVLGRLPSLANGVSFVFFLVLFSAWAVVGRAVLVGVRQFGWVGVGIGGAFVGTIIFAYSSGLGFADLFLYYVGRQSWWIAILLTVALVRLCPWRRLSPVAVRQWRYWAIAGTAVLISGLFFKIIAGRSDSATGMVVRVLSILVVPTVAFLGVALRTGAGLGVRLLLGGAALVGVATAALR